MSIINIEEIHTSDQLKKTKCDEAKAAMRDILSDDQLENFDKAFDSVMDKALKGVILKENKSADSM